MVAFFCEENGSLPLKFISAGLDAFPYSLTVEIIAAHKETETDAFSFSF